MYKPDYFATPEAGFSLLEILVTMAVMLGMMTAAFGLVNISLKTNALNYQTADIQERSRTAQEYLARDLISAGDGLRSITSVRVPTSFVSSYLTSTPIAAYTSNSVSYVDVGILTADNGNTSSPVSGVLAGTDRITVLALDSSGTAFTASAKKEGTTTNGTQLRVLTTSSTSFSEGEVYLFTAGYSAAFLVVRSATQSGSDTLLTCDSNSAIRDFGLNVPGQVDFVTNNGQLTGALTRMRIINYYVNAQGTLIRRVWGGKRPPGFATNLAYGDFMLSGTPIIDHVTDLQFRYLLNKKDTSGNLVAPDEQLTSAEELQAVRQIETIIEAESTQLMSGGRQRIKARNQVAVRNLQFFEAN